MENNNVLILGLGMQGKAALYYLVQKSPSSRIMAADNNPDIHEYLRQYPSNRVTGEIIDATDANQLTGLMSKADMVIEALPAPFTLAVGKLAAEVGVNLVSCMYYINPEERDKRNIDKIQEQLNRMDETARRKSITILSEFGLDPGIDLVMGAQALKELDTVEEFYSYGAGLPVREAAHNPLKYKFSWSPVGVMKSYHWPAWLISKGHEKRINGDEIFAPENRHTLELPEIDAQFECYPNGNSVVYAERFGLRGSIKEMGRYTCRWPGHCDFWEIFSKCGFLNSEPIKISGHEVSPREFTTAILDSQEQFHFSDNERDMTLVRVDIRGMKANERKRIIYQLIDYRDLKTGFTSMQRTVGYTLGLGARLIMEGRLNKRGLISPLDVPYNLLADGLRPYGMNITRQELPWEKN